MTKKPKTSKDAADKVVKNIRRKTRHLCWMRSKAFETTPLPAWT